MQPPNDRTIPGINKPIAGKRAYVGCLLVWVVGSLAAAELTRYALSTTGAVETNPISAALIRQSESLFGLARLEGYVLLFAIAAAPILVGRLTLRMDQYGRLAGRSLIFAGDFLLSLAALTGTMDALGDAIFAFERFNPFQNYLVEISEATIAALVLALVLNKVRIDRFLRDLYQISMM